MFFVFLLFSVVLFLSEVCSSFIVFVFVFVIIVCLDCFKEVLCVRLGVFDIELFVRNLFENILLLFELFVVGVDKIFFVFIFRLLLFFWSNLELLL